ncbi:hypothetical protein F4778DRAFT_747638 [Xylariomycetidae sp. FL2044]|nr:hypothetical protein F4778DRAFT_747638 [Xylariomycetidae sp. FL2044]
MFLLLLGIVLASLYRTMIHTIYLHIESCFLVLSDIHTYIHTFFPELDDRRKLLVTFGRISMRRLGVSFSPLHLFGKMVFCLIVCVQALFDSYLLRSLRIYVCVTKLPGCQHPSAAPKAQFQSIGLYDSAS